MSELHRVRVYFDINTYEGHKQDVMLIECYNQDEYTEKLNNCKSFLAERFNVPLDRVETYTAQLVK
jgi:hypothetical protein